MGDRSCIRVVPFDQQFVRKSPCPLFSFLWAPVIWRRKEGFKRSSLRSGWSRCWPSPVALSVLRQSSGLDFPYKAQAPQGTGETRQDGMSAVAVRLIVTSLTAVRDQIQNNRQTSETYGWPSADYSPIPRGRKECVPSIRSE